MTDKEKAQEAWKKHFEANLLGYHRDLRPTKSGIIQFADTAISDYRQALKKEIEEKHKALKVYGNMPNGWKAEAYREILQLLDTVKPD